MQDYKQTLQLPQTNFAMRAGLAQKEPELLRAWQASDLHGRILRSRAQAPHFILHDGPPYANGKLHHGHILNKVLKDIVVKDRTLAGFYVPYIPGWDCHGLPIETQVDKVLGKQKQAMSKVAFRRACRHYAAEQIRDQKAGFERLGVLGRFAAPYQTMDYGYEAQTLRELAKLMRSGLVYKGLRPVNWCLSHRTALAEAEVEYEEHTSPSIYAAFSLHPANLPAALQGGCDLVIWTTTPWTLPANYAIAVDSQSTYVAYLVKGRPRVVQQGLLAAFLQAIGEPPPQPDKVVYCGSGAVFVGQTYRHVFLPRDGVVLHGAHVTGEAGTGCVHTAPAHGVDDFELCRAHRIEAQTPLGHDGVLSAAAGLFGGEKVATVNPLIVAHLQDIGALLSAPDATLKHRYPHCWRCHKPIIIRATQQWFAAMDRPVVQGKTLREQVLQAADEVQWVPAWGHTRITSMFKTRPDWCLSRQRTWGVPFAVLYCTRCNSPKAEPELIDRVAAEVEKAGADIWFEAEVESLCGKQSCAKCGHTSFAKEMDILDVWFDSGVSYAAVIEPELSKQHRGPPIDLVLEGSDQHRGWFHASMLCAASTRQTVPFKAVLTHGFVVDGTGKKLSKSRRNYVDPQLTIDKDGAEIFRLWAASEDVHNDVRISPEILRRLADSYRKIRNTLRFMLGNLHDFDPQRHCVPPQKLLGLDAYALAAAQDVFDKVRTHYASYAIHAATAALLDLCTVDLSAFYLDVIKDRLYTEAPNAPARRSAQTALYMLTRDLIVHLSPTLCFTTEEAMQYLPKLAHDHDSVHLSYYPNHQKATTSPALRRLGAHVRQSRAGLLQTYQPCIALRREVNVALEQARKQGTIGASTQAAIAIKLPASYPQAAALQQLDNRFWAELFIVSYAEISVAQKSLEIAVTAAAGDRCARCWLYRMDLGHSAVHPQLCTRCVEAISDAP